MPEGEAPPRASTALPPRCLSMPAPTLMNAASHPISLLCRCPQAEGEPSLASWLVALAAVGAPQPAAAAGRWAEHILHSLHAQSHCIVPLHSPDSLARAVRVCHLRIVEHPGSCFVVADGTTEPMPTTHQTGSHSQRPCLPSRTRCVVIRSVPNTTTPNGRTAVSLRNE